MAEIKWRSAAIDRLLVVDGATTLTATTIESISLQYRHILELIAFSSLSANKIIYEKAHRNYEKHWNAELLLRDIERLNPNFYPIPHYEVASAEPGGIKDIVDVVDGVLSKTDFVEMYKKCGAIMHAANPFGRKKNYEYYINSFPTWSAKISKLLNQHSVKLYGEEKYWFIHMKEEQDDNVHYYEFVTL